MTAGAPAGRPDGAVPALALRALSKSYGAAVALAPLDLEVAAGQRIALIGHNGSGKTTLLRLVAGLLEPTGGSVEIAGFERGTAAARAAVSYLSDAPVFYDDLSVWEHLEYVARLHHTDEWEQRAVDLLDAVGLVERADDLPATFSRGLRQKAAIAIAFVRPFDVLLVDEPFVGLDRTGRDALLELLAAAHADGAAVVVASHDAAGLEAGERLLALRDGELIYDGSPTNADVIALSAGVRRDGD